MKKLIALLLIAFVAFVAFGPLAASAAEPTMDPDLRNKAKRATDEGLHFLRGTQADDGSWSQSVGITALALRAFLGSHRGYTEADGAFITRPVGFLLYHVRPDGSISESVQNTNYNTATAMFALQATGNPEYRTVIDNAQAFLSGLQIDEADGYERSHKYYGGIGYGGDERPDLSNMYLALEALKATNLNKDDPVWDKAVLFVSRSQNRSESNDLEFAGNDGGFAYMPEYSPHGEAKSYGAMTAAGLISLIYAGVDKDDPRIQDAWKWLMKNYTVTDNPGAVDKQGLFYFYEALAKVMAAMDEVEIVDAEGNKRNWRNDLATQLLSLQGEDGSWVNPYSTRWWEGNKDLITARAVIALNLIVQ